MINEDMRGGGIDVGGNDCDACGKLFADDEACQSYECNAETKKCQNSVTASTVDATDTSSATSSEGYTFCAKRLMGEKVTLVGATTAWPTDVNSGQGALKAIDGATNSRWSSNGWNGNVDESSITIELAKAVAVGRIDVYWERAKASTVSLFGKPVGASDFLVIAENVHTTISN